VVNSFSKYFSMTGWRIGWMVLPEDLIRPVECLIAEFVHQRALYLAGRGRGAFDCHDELRANIERYRRSRDHLLALCRARDSASVPGGGRFLFVRGYRDASNVVSRSAREC